MIRLDPRRVVVSLVVLWSLGHVAEAEPIRAVPEGRRANDARLEPLKTLNDYFPFTPPADRAAWEKRAAALRRQIQVGMGLWPMPTKTPAHAVVHGKVEREGYTVERVYLESFPGHFITGSLYRPTHAPGRRPAVLCPHGHWPEGRFYDAGPQKIRQDIVDGAERFDPAGRYPLQARCVQLARMGCVVFHYDMLGYADSQQLQHRPGMRPELCGAENWGYFSPQAEARLQHMMGLQTYNSIRALDWVSELPDVDPQRIGVTGASGGGTQTFVLCAIDPRPTVSFPAVMVSTAMQGGCTCENCSYLRVGSGNIEIAGLFAPKPLGMTGADDWTKEIMTKGLPELRQLYKLLGAPDRVMARALVQFPHNYNYVSRGVMYGWMNQHLGLKQPAPVVEEDFQPLSRAELTVWDAEHPAPPSGDDYERGLLRCITEDSQRQMQELLPRDTPSLVRWREVVGGAFEAIIGRTLPKPDEVEFEKTRDEDRGAYFEFAGVVRHKVGQEEVPTVFLHPKNWNKTVVIWVDANGKQGLFNADGYPRPEAQRLLESGTSIAALDMFGQGELTPDGKPLLKQPLAESGRDLWKTYAGYTFGYNHSMFARQVHDLLSVLAFIRGNERMPERVDITGLDGAGPWVAAARVIAGDAIGRAAIDTAGFRFETVEALDDPRFWPGAVKYGDVPALVALGSPLPVWLSGEQQAPEVVAAAYRAAGAESALAVAPDDQEAARKAAIEWLIQP